MNKDLILKKTVQYVKKELENAESGHDWWHIQRVWNNTLAILKENAADPFICQLAALLHDIADSKFHGGDESIGPLRAEKFLLQIGTDDHIASEVKKIIQNMSFTASLGELNYNSPELEVVQDADRLDAIGAIGIARAFNYGGYKNMEIYNPDLPISTEPDKEAYKNSKAPTIDHFYIKLLKLKDKMNTAAAKKLAIGRHEFLKTYLAQFFDEWKGLK